MVSENKLKIFTYLDQFLIPERMDMALPKPRVVCRMTGVDIYNVYYLYREWRRTHPDDRRVHAHDIKYHLIEESNYENTDFMPVL
jgi:hypothetical protein